MSSLGTLQSVAIFLPSFRGGGAERAMLLFAQELVRRGMRVDLLVAQNQGPFATLVPARARLIDLAAKGVLASLPKLSRYLRRERPSALYTTMSHSNIVAILAAMLSSSRTQVVVREANVPLSSLAHESATFAGRMVRKLIPVLYPYAHRVIAVSEEVSTELRRISERLTPKLSVLPTPVISDELYARAAEPLDHPWFTADAPPVVLAAGRLHPQKDFPTLIRAAAQVATTRPLRLIILGEGGERQALEQLVSELGAQEFIDLPGFSDNPFPYMKRAQMFVLSSRYEGMPNVLLQAMALGTPVIAADCPGGCRQVLDGGRYGTLVPVGDAAALADAIEGLLDAPRREDAAQHVVEQYGVERAADGYLGVLNGR